MSVSVTVSQRLALMQLCNPSVPKAERPQYRYPTRTRHLVSEVLGQRHLLLTDRAERLAVHVHLELDLARLHERSELFSTGPLARVELGKVVVEARLVRVKLGDRDGGVPGGRGVRSLRRLIELLGLMGGADCGVTIGRGWSSLGLGAGSGCTLHT